MKAVILAAGKGTRMLPLTATTPKPLIPVAGKPFLGWLLERLKAAGFTEYIFVVGHLKEQIIEYVHKQGLTAEFIHQKEQKGTGHALLQCKEHIKGEFILLGADNLWDTNDLKSLAASDNWAILATEVDDPSKYGILKTKEDFLSEIIEKPVHSSSNLANTGAYKLSEEIFPLLDSLTPSPRGEIELTDAITQYTKTKKVQVIKITNWLDLGSLKDLEKIDAILTKE